MKNEKLDAKVKSFQTEIKSVDVEARTIRHVISTGNIDREGDIISQDGWVFDSYRKNPVVLFAHDDSKPTIAKNLSLSVEGNNTIALTEFPKAGFSVEADLTFEWNRLGFMRTWSVRFNPLEWNYREATDEQSAGYNFLKQELIEYSAVPIPANVEAMTLAAKGLKVFREWKENTMRHASAPAPRDSEYQALLSLLRAKELRALLDTLRASRRTEAGIVGD